ncbi:hypothetical protein CJP46_02975 [Paenibacillus sp. XY044]|nr:hypothetical protein CJP46_02975 [Paenibacillus sp. XY044]
MLIDCFERDVGTELEEMLHDDKYVTSKLKKHLGTKVFKEYDALSEDVWRDAWMDFGLKMWKKQNT